MNLINTYVNDNERYIENNEGFNKTLSTPRHQYTSVSQRSIVLLSKKKNRICHKSVFIP